MPPGNESPLAGVPEVLTLTSSVVLLVRSRRKRFTRAGKVAPLVVRLLAPLENKTYRPSELMSGMPESPFPPEGAAIEASLCETKTGVARSEGDSNKAQRKNGVECA